LSYMCSSRSSSTTASYTLSLHDALPISGARKANRLIHAASPYLLQHAYNPVDWYEWGEEALNKAKQENKPILLSIGYSACHWCQGRKSTRLNSSHVKISYAVFCLKKKKK